VTHAVIYLLYTFNEHIPNFMKNLKNHLIVLLLIAAFSINSNLVKAQSSIVVTSNADSGAGTLRQAIINAVDGDIITFNLSTGNETITILSELVIMKSLTINGSNTAGSGTAVTVKVTTPGVSAWRVFDINAIGGKTTTISNMTIKGGLASNGGGGIMFQNLNTYNLNYVNITESKCNGTYGGGGIYASSVLAINLNHCSVYGNESSGAYGGGGAYFWNCASVKIENSSIYNNTSTNNGGGIYAQNRDLPNSNAFLLINSTIFGNVITGTTVGKANGGGLWIDLFGVGNCNIKNSTISDNKAHRYGGGLFLNGGDLMVQNTILGNNTLVLSSTNGGYGKDYYNYNLGTLTDNGYNIIEYQDGYYIIYFEKK